MSKAVTTGTYNRWTVIGKSEEKDKWFCRCKCGTEKAVRGCHLRSGRSKGCMSCHSSQPRFEVGKRFNHVPKKVYIKLKQAAKDATWRCTNPTHKRYHDWGGRGIKVQFTDRIEFIEHLLTLPGHDDLTLTLDRINNDGHYEPGNLRFVSRSESQRNKRKKR